MWILNNWDAEQIDVKTAFLNGELEEEIYMRTPKGMNLPIGYCLLLNKSIYGLVQASQQWWKKFINFLNKIGFKNAQKDPVY